MNMNELTLTHSGETLRVADLPSATIARLVNEGFTHFYGNRVASAVIGDFRANARKDYKATHGDEAWAKLTDSERAAVEKAGIPASDSDAYRAAIETERAAFWEKAKAGKLGEGREAGPKASPLEVEMASIAKRETIGILTTQKLFEATGKRRVPKAEDAFEIGGTSRTFESLCAARLQRFHDRIEKEAKAELAKRDRATAKAAEAPLDEAF